MRVKAAKWGNSVAVRLPKLAAEALGVRAGGDLELSLKGDVVELAPARRFKTLEELCEEARRLGPGAQPESVDWGPDVGAEIIRD